MAENEDTVDEVAIADGQLEQQLNVSQGSSSPIQRKPQVDFNLSDGVNDGTEGQKVILI